MPHLTGRLSGSSLPEPSRLGASSRPVAAADSRLAGPARSTLYWKSRYGKGSATDYLNAAMSREQYVEMFGSEGAELMMWLVMRGAMDPEVVVRHKHYFVPASMTGAGMIVMENRAPAAA